jgi:HTH-type transcriptional regulator/antitoxin HigA
MIDRLIQQDMDEGQEAYLDALTDLVETYEDRHVMIPDASEADVLRELMASNGLSQSAIAKKVGISQSTISAVLTGNRSLTKSQVETLAKFFRISPAVFFSV